MLQDITIYAEKCKSLCGSNVCPIMPYYKDPNALQCISICPIGYIGNPTTFACDPVLLCHSNCTTCNAKNDPAQCSSCTSTLTELNTATESSGSCVLPISNNAQWLMTVNKQTGLNSFLKNVTYDSPAATITSPTTDLTNLYHGNVIDFMGLTANTIVYQFDNLPVHRKLLVRARVLSDCVAPNNNSVLMTLSGPTETTVSMNLVAGQ